jgi:glutathione S-transferase
MRARMGLLYSGIVSELREIKLGDKPASMLEVSKKGTVPVLVLSNGEVLDESRDILMWALETSDPDDWLMQDAPQQVVAADALIDHNDGEFKSCLDRYKYHERFPEQSMEQHRASGESFLLELDQRLNKHTYLIGNSLSYADIAIVPFVRQYAHCDKVWFGQTPYAALQAWLDGLLQSDGFVGVMKKYLPWQVGDKPIYFP